MGILPMRTFLKGVEFFASVLPWRRKKLSRKPEELERRVKLRKLKIKK
jgi:hypothetical protein